MIATTVLGVTVLNKDCSVFEMRSFLQAIIKEAYTSGMRSVSIHNKAVTLSDQEVSDGPANATPRGIMRSITCRHAYGPPQVYPTTLAHTATPVPPTPSSKPALKRVRSCGLGRKPKLSQRSHCFDLVTLRLNVANPQDSLRSLQPLLSTCFTGIKAPLLVT